MNSRKLEFTTWFTGKPRTMAFILPLYSSRRVMNHVVQETMSFLDIFLPLCVALFEQLCSILYSNVVSRVFSWRKYDYSFTTFQWSSKSFQIPAIELLVQSNLKEKIQFLNCENFVLSKFSNKKSLTIKIFFEKKYMTFFCFVSFVFLVKILKILLEILILFNFKIILLFKILTKKNKGYIYKYFVQIIYYILYKL